MVKLYDMLDLRRIEQRHRRATNIHGFSFGAGGRCGAVAAFDPGTLSLNGWWRASYTGSPWAGQVLSRDLTEATFAPATGSALNGLTPADFDGSNDRLDNATSTLNYFTTGAGAIIALFNADAAAADAGATTPYNNPALFTDQTNGFLSLSFSTSGVRFGGWNGSNFDSFAVACATGGWHLAQAKWDATTLYLRVDSGSWSTLTRVIDFSLGTGIRVGGNYNASVFFDGKIAEVMLDNSTISDANFDNVKNGYINPRYALSL